MDCSASYQRHSRQVCADLQVHFVDAASVAGIALKRMRRKQRAHALSSKPEHAADPNIEAGHLPLAAALSLPGHFELGALACTVFGVDLPGQLPRICTRPPRQLLLSVTDDCAAALDAVRDMRAKLCDGEAQTARRATRWALKRVVRAAAELTHEAAATYSRDLYWCCEDAERHLPACLQRIAQLHHPAMLQHVVHVARHRLGLRQPSQVVAAKRPTDAESNFIAATIAREVWRLAQLYVDCAALAPGQLEDAAHDAAQLAEVLQACALAQLTCMPCGYPFENTGSAQLAHEQKNIGPSKQQGLQGQASLPGQQPPPVAAHGKRRSVQSWLGLQHAASWLLRGVQEPSLRAHIAGAAPPQHAVPITHTMLEFDCASAQGRIAAGVHLAALSADPLAFATSEPLVLRGVAAGWRACEQWSLDHLVRRAGAARGRVRVSRSLAFPFVQPQLAAAAADVCRCDVAPTWTQQV